MKLTLLVGQISSGKSTYCKQRVNEGAVIINDDSIVESLHAGVYTLYDKKLKTLYKTVENTILATAISLGVDVIIDRPNLRIESRARYISIARSFDVEEIEAYVFQFASPEEHAYRRFQSDARGHSYEYWLRVAREKSQSYQPVFYDEGFSKIINAKDEILVDISKSSV